MGNILRRIRGAVGTGLTWAFAWAAAQVAVLGGFTLLGGASVPLIAVGFSALSGATIGFLSGLAFAVGFGVLNRDKSLADIRLGSTALLGAGAGVIFPVAFGTLLALAGLPGAGVAVAVNLVMGATMGGATAYGLVRIAQSAENRALHGGDSPGAIGSDRPGRLGSGGDSLE